MIFAIPMSFQYEWLELVTLKYGLSSLFCRSSMKIRSDPNRVVVHLLDRLDDLRHPHVVPVRMVGARDLEVRVVFLVLPLEHEDQIGSEPCSRPPSGST